MVTAVALAGAGKEVGVLIAALAASGTLLLRGARGRAIAALVAFALTPVLVVAELWSSRQVEHLRGHVALAALVGVAAAALMVGLAVLIARRPVAFPLLAVGTLPFRIPIESGTDSANLLLPLYVVVGAGVLAYAWQRLRPTRVRAVAAGNGSHGLPDLRERRPGRLELALAIAVVLYALQASYSADFEQAVKNVAFFYVPFVLLFKLLTTTRWSRQLLVACFGVALALGLVFAGVGYLEYATRHVLWNQKVIASNQFESYFRVNSLFFDPSIYGRYLALVMIGLAATLVWPRRAPEIGYATAALAILWGGLLLSFSQSSYGALLIGLVLLAGLRWDPRPVLFGAAVAAAAGLVVVVIDPGVVNLNLGSRHAVNKASSGRFRLVRGGLDLFSARPVTGFGSGSFSKEYREREGVGSATASTASHTIPLTIAAEQGVLGLAAYLFVVISAFGLLFRGLGALRQRGPPTPELVARAFVAAAFTALFFHTLVYADFLEDPIAWALLAVGAVLARGEAARLPEPTPQVAVAAR
jgi:O-antigen ligase